MSVVVVVIVALPLRELLYLSRFFQTRIISLWVLAKMRIPDILCPLWLANIPKLDIQALLLSFPSLLGVMSLMWGWVVQQGTLHRTFLCKMHKLGHHVWQLLRCFLHPSPIWILLFRGLTTLKGLGERTLCLLPYTLLSTLSS
jgi:hypothetical protein